MTYASRLYPVIILGVNLYDITMCHFLLSDYYVGEPN